MVKQKKALKQDPPKLFVNGRCTLSGDALEKEFDKYFTYLCEKCLDDCTGDSLKFTRFGDLKDHCDEQHGTFKFVAKCCTHTFRYRCQMVTHIHGHVQPEDFICLECNKSFTDSSKLNHHKESVHKRTNHKCEACNIYFPSEDKLSYHKLTAHAAHIFQCDICQKRYPSQMNLRLHKQTHTAELVQCPICNKSFKGRKNLSSHITFKHSDKHKCPHCDYSTGLLTAYRKHVATVDHSKVSEVKKEKERSLECDQCPMTFQYPSTKASHMLRVHKVATAKKRKRQESEEDTEDSSGSTDEDEDVKVEEDPVETEGVTIIPPEKPKTTTSHLCGPCDKFFPSDAELQKHISAIHPPTGYLCPHCGQSLANSNTLFKHIQNKHPTRTFQCDQCEYNTANKQHLKRHMITHSNLFQCDKCPASFSTNFHLIRHDRGNHQETPICHICGKEWGSQSHLRRHLRHKHRLPDETYNPIPRKRTPKNAPVEVPVAVEGSLVTGDSYANNNTAMEVDMASSSADRHSNFATGHNMYVAHEEEVVEETEDDDLNLLALSRQLKQEIVEQVVEEEQIIEISVDVNTLKAEANSDHSDDDDIINDHSNYDTDHLIEEDYSGAEEDVDDTNEETPDISIDPLEVHTKSRPRKLTDSQRQLYIAEFDKYCTYRCDDCVDVILSNYAEMKAHFEVLHNSLGFAYCCGKKIYRKALTQHIKSHSAKKDLSCPECQMEFTAQSSLRRHLRDVHSKLVRPETAAEMANYDRYFKYRCDECPEAKSLTSFAMMREHFQSVHQSLGYAWCCERKISSDMMKGHWGYHLAPEKYTCPKCKLVLPARTSLGKHIRQNKCAPAKEGEEGEAVVVIKGGKDRGVRRESVREYDRMFKYHCEECFEPDGMFKALLSYEDMKMHFTKEHGSKGYGFCCGKKILKHDFSAHLQWHTQPENFACPHCKKMFHKKGTLTTHIRIVHEKVEKRPSDTERRRCGLCDIRFETYEEFTRHRKEHHTPPASCEQCGKTCTNVKGLRQHIKECHPTDDISPDELVCPTCGKLAKTKEALRLHIRNQHTNPDLMCPCCPYTTKFRNCLKLHLAKHDMVMKGASESSIYTG